MPTPRPIIATIADVKSGIDRVWLSRVTTALETPSPNRAMPIGRPIGIALFGLGVSSAVVTLLSHTLSMPDFTSAMVAMIGLGVGIDYALFIVTRYREALHAGSSVEDSIAEALDTSGRAVIFAGTTVIIALLGLSLMGLAFVTGVAIASAVGVLL